MHLSGKDIRFSKDCAGAALYPYFIEGGKNSAFTKVWVLIDMLPANGTRLINICYGNPSAMAASSFDSTFTPASRLLVTAGSVTLRGNNSYSWFEVAAGATVVLGPTVPLKITARRIKRRRIISWRISFEWSGARLRTRLDWKQWNIWRRWRRL